MAVVETPFDDEIRGAVARGWCHQDSEDRVMDVVLAGAIAEEVATLLAPIRDRITELEEALRWCSGSADFAPGGKASAGWDKLCRPLLVAPG